MPKGQNNAKKKDRFADLPQEFRNLIDNSDEAQTRAAISKVACDQHELMKLKGEDQQLKESAEKYREDGALYRDGTKGNKLKIAYAYARLEAMGKE